jgi:hypothetical protein
MYFACSGGSESRVRISVFVSKSARRGDADTVSRDTEPRGRVAILLSYDRVANIPF